MKKMVAAVAAGMMMLTMGACAKHKNSYNVECDAGDYREHDIDCGYTNSAGIWQYYSWTRPGTTTYAPDDWQPPAEVAHLYEDEGHHHKSHKKAPKPKKSSAKPKSIAATKAPVAKPTPKVVKTTRIVTRKK